MNLKPIRPVIDYALNDYTIDKDEFINNLFSFLSLNKLLSYKQIVIGVSGGPDSMLLSYLLKEFSVKYDFKFHAVIVDHQFRKFSFKEASLTQKRLKMNKISSEIVKLEKCYKKNGLQEWAHFKRLEILSSIATSKNSILFLGHHLNDQVETVFMRMAKGSGFWGASGIKFFNYWFNTPVIRPLFQYTKKSILKTCKKYLIEFENDNSNFETKFDRVKARNELDQLNERKLILKNIYLASNFIGKITFAIDNKINELCLKSFPVYDLGFCVIDVPSLLKLNKAISLRILLIRIKTIGGGKYFVKNKNADLLLNHLEKYKNNLSRMPGRTLGGCKIAYRYKKVFILRWSQFDVGKRKMPKLGNMIFDNRWQIFSKGNIRFEYLQNADLSFLQGQIFKKVKIPIETWRYLPVSLKIFNFKNLTFYLDEIASDNHINLCKNFLLFINKEYNINIKFIKPIIT